MDYEKKYKEALEKARQLCAYPTTKPFISDLQDLFPELKESKEEWIEKIRQELKSYLGNREVKQISESDAILQWIAWIEKQGEPTDINPSEFDLRLNKLLKQFETLPKEELMDSLSFYLNVIQNDGTYKADEKQGEQKHKFIIGDIISNNNVIYRVDNIVKNCIGQDCYFLVDIEKEKRGIRYLIMRDSEGKTSYMGEITWLCDQVDAKFEKQDEKHTDKIEPKFHEGDWIISNNKKYIYQVVKVKRGIYVIRDNADNHEYHVGIESADRDGRLWNISDAKDGDVLVNGSNIFIFHFINDTRLMGYCHVNTDDGRFYDDIGKNECFCLIDAVVNPATKEQCDILMKAMADAGYKFDFEKKELKKIDQKSVDDIETSDKYEGLTDFERTLADICIGWTGERLGWKQYVKDNADILLKFKRKPTWSEEDERIYYSLLADIRARQDGSTSTLEAYYKKQIDWVKSLKQRIGWKPSKKQIDALDSTLQYCKVLDNSSEHLNSLYNDLKKLTE